MFQSLKDTLCRIIGRKSLKCGRIGLALGSGSARGWAHIGVLRALDEAGIKIDYIAGTSIGALVGAVYSSGRMDELEDTVRKFNWKQTASMLDIVFPKSGLIDGKKVSAFVQDFIIEGNIEDMSIPFCAVAADLRSGKEIQLNSGNIVEAVRASVSIPGIFTPARKGDMFLLDGGLVNPVPVSVVRKMGADFVIAVDLNHDLMKYEKEEMSAEKNGNGRKNGTPGIFDVMASSINTMGSRITDINLKHSPADMLILPKLGHINFMEFSRAEEAIEEGYRAAKYKLNGGR